MKLRTALAVVSALVLAPVAAAEDVKIAGMTSKTPAGWKDEPSTSEMRLAQFKLPKAEGDKEDAELVIFYFKGGSGSAEQNLNRQLAKFQPAEGEKELKVKVDKVKVGKHEAPYQDIQGTYLSKSPPFDPKAKVTLKAEYRQLYVPLITDSGDYYVILLGPDKTVEMHKKDFEEWLKNFK